MLKQIRRLEATNESLEKQLGPKKTENFLKIVEQDYQTKCPSEADDSSSIMLSDQSSNPKYNHHSENFLKERVNELEEDVFELRKVKNNLELKVRTIERKAESEVSLYKKKLAMEIYNWREKYAKLRYENSSLKGAKEHSISMDLSRDE